MNITQALSGYSTQPLTHQLLMWLLKDYKRPNDKVHSLLTTGILSPVKKGLYIAGPAVKATKPEPFTLANHILGPSYISMDAALSYYGLIAERVFEITSMTTKASRTFKTPEGIFSYTHLALPYYSFGIRQEQVADEQFVMMASPEKALFDKVLTTSGIIFRSPINVLDYLVDDLRIDEDSLKELDTNVMASWLPDTPKKETFKMIIKVLNKL